MSKARRYRRGNQTAPLIMLFDPLSQRPRSPPRRSTHQILSLLWSTVRTLINAQDVRRAQQHNHVKMHQRTRIKNELFYMKNNKTQKLTWVPYIRHVNTSTCADALVHACEGVLRSPRGIEECAIVRAFGFDPIENLQNPKTDLVPITIDLQSEQFGKRSSHGVAARLITMAFQSEFQQQTN